MYNVHKKRVRLNKGKHKSSDKMRKFCIVFLCTAIELINIVLAKNFYCVNGKTELIEGQTEGQINTRQFEGGFYANNLLCSWRIDAGVNRLIKLSVLISDLQWSPQYTTCSGYDNLQIIEGDNIDGKSITSVCGARNPFNVISKGQHLFLQFSSTHQNFGNHRGVEIKFEIFENQTCAPGWFEYEGDTVYCLRLSFLGTASWTDSQDICGYSQSNLVSISNETEYQAIKSYGINRLDPTFWIGLSDLLSEGSFKWVDTQSYSIIRSLSGNNFRKHCVSIDFKTDEWTVHECDRIVLNYICKSKKDGSTVLYSAEPSSGPPIEADDSSNTYLIVILVIGGVIFITGLTLFVCCCILKRKDRPCCGSSSQSDQRIVQYSTVNQTNFPDEAPPSYADVVK